MEKATSEIMEVLKIQNFNIVYTANATEANNLGIYGVVLKQKTGKIITSKIEHPSVLEVFKDLETKGYDVVYLDCDSKGIIDLKQLENEIDKSTILVSIMWVNNIVGTIEPIDKVIEIVKKNPKTKLHVDFVQGLSKIVPNFDFNKIDLFTLSAHKFYGPKGIGALVYNKNIDLEKRFFGANNQYAVKPGTTSLALIVSFCKAIKKFYPETKAHYDYVKNLNNVLRDGIEKLDFIHINSSIEGSPYIINISIPSVNGETILHALESRDIYVSTGSACSSKLKKPEKTVFNMTKSIELATSMIRISLAHLSTNEEIEALIEALKEVKNV
jgi:cysteine desulfurase